MEQIIEKITELNCHGVNYLIKVNANSQKLMIELEEKYTGDIWKNLYSSEYIQGITQKTGNAKKFPVFVQMLMGAINQASDSVFIQVLTSHDLEMLQQRKNYKNGKPNPTNSSTSNFLANSTMNNQRYLILNYIPEYDKIHYPIPLDYEENPDTDTLKATIRRMKFEIEDLQSSTMMSGEALSSRNNSMMLQMKQQNELLRSKVKKLEQGGSGMLGGGSGGYQRNSPQKDNREVNQLKQILMEKNEEIQFLKERIDEQEKDCGERKSEILRLKSELANFGDLQATLRKYKETQQNLIQANKRLVEKDQELTDYQSEVQDLRNQEKKHQSHIHQLEVELEAAIHKNRLNSHRAMSPANNQRSFKSQSPSSIYLKQQHSTPKHSASQLSKSTSSVRRTPVRNHSIDSDTESSKIQKLQNKLNSPLRLRSNSNSKHNSSSTQITHKLTPNKVLSKIQTTKTTRLKLNFQKQTNQFSKPSPNSKTQIKSSPLRSTSNSNLNSVVQTQRGDSSQNESQQTVKHTNVYTQLNSKSDNQDHLLDEEDRLNQQLEELRNQNKNKENLMQVNGKSGMFSNSVLNSKTEQARGEKGSQHLKGIEQGSSEDSRQYSNLQQSERFKKTSSANNGKNSFGNHNNVQSSLSSSQFQESSDSISMDMGEVDNKINQLSKLLKYAQEV